jgi:uncharacterized protein YbcI
LQIFGKNNINLNTDIVQTKAIIEMENIITQSYTISENHNALSTGPVTVANGVIITVPEGSTWTVM